jgi:hypothetical protein
MGACLYLFVCVLSLSVILWIDAERTEIATFRRENDLATFPRKRRWHESMAARSGPYDPPGMTSGAIQVSARRSGGAWRMLITLSAMTPVAARTPARHKRK